MRAVLDARNDSSIFEFRNTSDEEVSVQVEVMKWTQVDGVDEFESTNDFVVVPRIIKLEADKAQVARLALFKDPGSDKESSYRIFFTEILKARDPDQTNNISMRLRISIPVFVNPENEIDADLQLGDFTQEEGKNYLEFSNFGNQHIQLLNLFLEPEEGEPIEQAVSVYLLPGQKKKVMLQTSDVSSLHSIKIDTDTSGMLTYALDPSGQ